MSTLYGVDLDHPTTPIAARDALVQCFVEAHDDILEQMNEFSDTPVTPGAKELTVKTLLKKMFAEHNGNFENPTKKDLINACNALRTFSEHFRDTAVIEKHFNEIKQIIALIPDA